MGTSAQVIFKLDHHCDHHHHDNHDDRHGHHDHNDHHDVIRQRIVRCDMMTHWGFPRDHQWDFHQSLFLQADLGSGGRS